MTRRFFLQILFALGLENFFPKFAKAETEILNSETEFLNSQDKNFQMLVFADSQCVDYKVWKKVADFADKNFPNAKIATVIGDLVDNGAADWQC